MADIRYYEDPTGFFRNLEIPVDDATTRALEEREREEAEVVLDDAVGRGAITSAERARWRRYLRKAPRVIRETLEALPGRPDAAERALTEDERLRAFSDAFEDYLGISPEDRERQYDDQPDTIERQWLAYCNLEGGES